MTIKWFMSPYNWVISPMTQPQVANPQKIVKIIVVVRKKNNTNAFLQVFICSRALWLQISCMHLNTLTNPPFPKSCHSNFAAQFVLCYL